MEVKDLIIQHSAGNLYWKDRNLKYLGCNENFSKIAKLNSPEDIIGRTDKELFNAYMDKESLEKLSKLDRHIIDEKVEIVCEEVGVNENGEKAIFLTRKIPLIDDNNNVIGLVGTSIDISKQKISEAAKSEFLANMSHDIRTPITGMIGMIQDLINLADQTESSLIKNQKNKIETKMKTILNRVRSDSHLLMGATNELLNLCNEILEVVEIDSNPDESISEVFSLHRLIRNSINLLQPVAQDKSLRLQYNIDQKLPEHLIGNRLFLNRILLNLIGNALKFTKEGEVTVSITSDNTVKSNLQSGDSLNIKISVKDTGIGIPKDKFETIFENFSRLDPSYKGLYKGAGLGLYRVKRYVESMKGKIDLKSKVGKGTCFSLILPFTVSNETHPDKKIITDSALELRDYSLQTEKLLIDNTTSPAQHTSISVLIVEDQKLAAHAVKTSLESLDCNTELAETGAQALEMAEKGNYDLILMDIGLPDLNGMEVAKKIRTFSETKKSQVPIVALTGHANNQKMRQESLEAGMQDVITKPAQPPIVKSILEKYVFNAKKTNKETSQRSLGEEDTLLVTLPIIDWGSCLKMYNGDTEFINNLLEMLADDLKTTHSLFKESYSHKDFEALRSELHRCRGGIAYLKLPELEQSLKQFHDALTESSKDKTKLETSYLAALNAIEKFWNEWKENKL